MTSLQPPRPSRRTVTRGALALGAVTALGTSAACSRPVVADQAAAREARGPVTMWTSNNEQELGWGHAVAEAWNGEQPDEQGSSQEVPAGASTEEASTAATCCSPSPLPRPPTGCARAGS